MQTLILSLKPFVVLCSESVFWTWGLQPTQLRAAPAVRGQLAYPAKQNLEVSACHGHVCCLGTEHVVEHCTDEVVFWMRCNYRGAEAKHYPAYLRP